MAGHAARAAHSAGCWETCPRRTTAVCCPPLEHLTFRGPAPYAAAGCTGPRCPSGPCASLAEFARASNVVNTARHARTCSRIHAPTLYVCLSSLLIPAVRRSCQQRRYACLAPRRVCGPPLLGLHTIGCTCMCDRCPAPRFAGTSTACRCFLLHQRRPPGNHIHTHWPSACASTAQGCAQTPWAEMALYATYPCGKTTSRGAPSPVLATTPAHPRQTPASMAMATWRPPGLFLMPCRGAPPAATQRTQFGRPN